MDELLIKYAEQFGENFPIFCMRGESEKAVCEVIQQCLDSGKPYDLPDDNPNDDY